MFAYILSLVAWTIFCPTDITFRQFGILAKIEIRHSAVPQSSFVEMMQLPNEIFIRNGGRRMEDERSWFTWDLFSTGQIFVQTSVVFVLFHLFRNTDNSHSIIMVLTVAQTHWRLFGIELRFLQAMKGLGLINAKRSSKSGSFARVVTYTILVGRTSCVLQGNCSSKKVLKLSKRGLKIASKGRNGTGSGMPCITQDLGHSIAS